MRYYYNTEALGSSDDLPCFRFRWSLNPTPYTLHPRPGMQAKKRGENGKTAKTKDDTGFATAEQVASLVFQRILAARRGAERRAAARAASGSSVLPDCRIV